MHVYVHVHVDVTTAIKTYHTVMVITIISICGGAVHWMVCHSDDPWTLPSVFSRTSPLRCEGRGEWNGGDGEEMRRWERGKGGDGRGGGRGEKVGRDGRWGRRWEWEPAYRRERWRWEVKRRREGEEIRGRGGDEREGRGWEGEEMRGRELVSIAQH